MQRERETTLFSRLHVFFFWNGQNSLASVAKGKSSSDHERDSF